VGAPWGQRGEARRRTCSSALPRRRGAGTWPGSPAVCGGRPAAAPSQRCTDRSAGGCVDWRTLVTTRARALRGLDAAEASPRRCVSWRSRGRRWRGPSARATDRPCRISAVQAGSLTPARPGVPGKPLVREPLRDSAPPAADSAGEGSHVPLPGQTRAVTAETRGHVVASCAHKLGKTGHTGGESGAASRG